ncbi:ATP synthase subunit I [Megasphaera paucivorans]|uniref:ATP synthase I chain n=1 Tax=Megasphaera paucivorans TaxID=349095 RepID=A0A1G9TWJ5_9FIRM|nr:ATP synthase subunit I [Megasphaera paucivorans]SDM51958.1 hypothetical protein SAMN05660299_01034 [Megasphaera paucivorans]
MNYFIDYIKGTLKKLIVFTCTITALLALCGYTNLILGWLIGCSLNIVYFLMLSSRSSRAMKMHPVQAVAFIKGGAFLRLITIILSLIVVLHFPVIHFGAAVAGVLSFKVYTYLEVTAKFVYTRLERR